MKVENAKPYAVFEWYKLRGKVWPRYYVLPPVGGKNQSDEVIFKVDLYAPHTLEWLILAYPCPEEATCQLQS